MPNAFVASARELGKRRSRNLPIHGSHGISLVASVIPLLHWSSRKDRPFNEVFDLANDFKHNGVVFYDEDGFKCILFRLSHRFHLAQVKCVFSDSDGGYPPELEVSLLGGYEF